MKFNKIATLLGLVIFSTNADPKVNSKTETKSGLKIGFLGGLAMEKMTVLPTVIIPAAIKATDKRKRPFGGFFIETTHLKESQKKDVKIGLGISIEILHSLAKPEYIDPNLNLPDHVDLQLKHKGSILMIGPKIDVHKGKFALSTGVSLSLTGYKYIITDNLNQNPVGAYTSKFETRLFAKAAAMPWIRVGRKIGKAEIFVMFGQQLKSKPNFHRTTRPSDFSMVGLDTWENAATGFKPVKTSGRYFGIGTAIKI